MATMTSHQKLSSVKSRLLNSGCAIVVCAGLFLAGCFALYLTASNMIIPVWRANNIFVAHTCVVRERRLGESRGQKGVSYRPEILIRYSVDNRDHDCWAYNPVGTYTSKPEAEEGLKQFEIGKQYPCWVDPDDPGQAVLDRGRIGWWYLTLVVPLTFIGVGGAGMVVGVLGIVRGGPSPERLP
jgi:hypothetical protein